MRADRLPYKDAIGLHTKLLRYPKTPGDGDTIFCHSTQLTAGPCPVFF